MKFKKAMTGIDWVVAYTIFLGGILFAINYIHTTTFSLQNKIDIYPDENIKINNAFINETTSTYTTITLNFSGKGAKKYFFRIYEKFDYNNDTSISSTHKIYHNYLYPYFIFQDFTKTNTYEILYSTNPTSQSSTFLNITKNQNNISNSLILVGFNNNGINHLYLNSYSYLKNGINLSDTFIKSINYSVTGLGNFSETKVYIPYNNTAIYIYFEKPKNLSISLINNFTNYYNGTENIFNNSGLQYSGNQYYLDIYNNKKGILFIGNFSEASLYNKTDSKELFINNTNYLEIYLHNNTYTNALNEINYYHYNLSRELPVYKQYFKKELLESLTSISYSSFKKKYGINTDFNITFTSKEINTTFGKKPPKNIDIHSYTYKCHILYNSTSRECKYSIKVW